MATGPVGHVDTAVIHVSDMGNIEEGWIYLVPQFQRFHSVVLWLHCAFVEYCVSPKCVERIPLSHG